MIKTIDVTYDQLKLLALRCPIELPKSDGKVVVKSGSWIAWAAGNEEVKRFTKAAKRDLLERQIRGGSYDGDLGRVVIGGHLFRLYPKAKALIRSDFAAWIDANGHKYINKAGEAKESNRPLHVEDIEPLPISRHSLEAKAKARDLEKPTTLIRAGCWNSEYDMKKRARDYGLEIAADKKQGVVSAITRMQYDQLIALCAYRDRAYNASVDAFLNVAAWALQAAEFVCNTHSKTKEANK